ncbi:DNA topoisomerase-1 [Sphingomonas sp. BE138]|uniref:type I DNA topoisomerase n=1 Tax=Sphingomonas sp. BE138 TaxID=2817845 RepID=UPI00285973BA|nr:type I DNA topoisomerase [Sphingomonas sp. BE138]MDR6788146.1 DNA topoisomerase-1 [Sphingomonas sp. BE138]
MQLVIVESPAKAKTIEKYLGSDYRVLASYGHVRDLPPRDGSVNPDEGFAMEWENYADKTKQLKAIADAAKTADRLILATDPDREGEAISWHVQEVLAKRKALPKDVQRVTFNAITKQAVTQAMQAPRDLDTDLIDAYRARRALDYLVGFTLSPVLWRKLPGAKSAGRVQSVALRLIVDREREIEAFRAQEYWSITAAMEQDGMPFSARLVQWQGKKLDRLSIGAEGDALKAKADVEAGNFSVQSVETKPATRNPPPPFTTSTLQQEAARKLGFSADHTMRIAQQLYEDGAITYMRTDGVQMDGSAISAARAAIADRYDGGYVPDKPRQYQTKAKNAQEAHEAIRPTDFSKDRVGGGDHARLYDLVWKRALASQMASARMERTTIELADGTGRNLLRATGQVVLFPGYLALYEEGQDDKGFRGGSAQQGDAEDEDAKRLPRMREGDSPAKKDIVAEQHFTQPPPRFSEASLVKRMEELGIGRPSTYASIIKTLKDRAYVRVEKNRFFAEESGRLVTAFLERFFEKYVGFDYTAGLEEELDDVSGGRAQWQAVLEAFWRDFKPRTAEVMEQKPSEVTAALDQFLAPYLFPEKADGSDPRLCPACHAGQLALRGGKFGAFIACSNYPECKYTRRFAQGGDAAAEDTGPEQLGHDPETGLPVERKSGRFGPYIQLGEGKEAKRASIPKDIGDLDLEMALRLLHLPRTVGQHPETGQPITASIGRYGPYLLHDGKYARLSSTAEVFETGMNAAVVKLAEAAAGGGRPARGAARAPLKVLGAHPRTEAELKLMEGRYGPYVTDGTTNATLPKTIAPDQLTLEEAAQLIDDRAAAAPAKPKKKAPAKKAAAKKPAAKKAPAKKTAKKE